MWICSQIGAREHYAIPRALHKTGRLATLYTDFWAGRAVRRAQELGDGRLKLGALRSLAARYHPELDGGREIGDGRWEMEGGAQNAKRSKHRVEIVSWNFRALWWEGMLRRKQKTVVGGPYQGYIEVGRRFAERVREDLKRRKDLGPDSIFFAYDTGALEALEWCRERGIKCVLDQMDPNRVEVELVRSEEKQWPGWALEAIQVPEAYFERREREWALADRVVVNSEFSRRALIQQGVPPEKLAVVPLCYGRDMEDKKLEARNQKLENGNEFQISALSPLRVLFLGQVILRKGIQYLLAAAKLLEHEPIRFDVVGPIGISREALATAPGNVTFHGRTGREQAADWYRRSHLFVLPTLSDGFAITQLEAMAHGLPVVTTPCCGDVVSDGVDGFVVPARDAGALALTFKRYLAQPDLLPSQSADGLLKAGQFTLARLAKNLVRLEAGLK
jgi:glycosyltransferase involved in cell wall biosynthesis